MRVCCHFPRAPASEGHDVAMAHTELDAELWAMLMKDILSMPQLLRMGSVCREARRALGLVQCLYVEAAAQCDVRLTRLFSSVTTVYVKFIRKASLAETLAANPQSVHCEADVGASEETNQVSVADQMNVALRCNYGGGLGVLEVADEEMVARLAFALAPMPLRQLRLSAWQHEDATDQVLAVTAALILGVCNARAAGALQDLYYIGPLGHTHCSFTRPKWRHDAQSHARRPHGSGSEPVPLPAEVEHAFEQEHNPNPCPDPNPIVNLDRGRERN